MPVEHFFTPATIISDLLPRKWRSAFPPGGWREGASSPLIVLWTIGLLVQFGWAKPGCPKQLLAEVPS